METTNLTNDRPVIKLKKNMDVEVHGHYEFNTKASGNEISTTAGRVTSVDTEGTVKVKDLITQKIITLKSTGGKWKSSTTNEVHESQLDFLVVKPKIYSLTEESPLKMETKRKSSDENVGPDRKRQAYSTDDDIISITTSFLGSEGDVPISADEDEKVRKFLAQNFREHGEKPFRLGKHPKGMRTALRAYHKNNTILISSDLNNIDGMKTTTQFAIRI
jgi:hypothetical protein